MGFSPTLIHKKSNIILKKGFGLLSNKNEFGRITKEIFNSKLKEWKEKQSELEAKMAQYTNADESFYLNANMLLIAVKKASQVFEGSEPATKRQILNFLLQNLKLTGKKLNFELKTPFDRVLQANSCSTMLRTLNEIRTFFKENSEQE